MWVCGGLRALAKVQELYCLGAGGQTGQKLGEKEGRSQKQSSGDKTA